MVHRSNLIMAWHKPARCRFLASGFKYSSFNYRFYSGACYLLFVILGGLVTAPFNEELSQRVEEIVTNQQLHKMGFWEDAFISIKGELEKIVFYIVILFIIFLLDFIPVAGNV